MSQGGVCISGCVCVQGVCVWFDLFIGWCPGLVMYLLGDVMHVLGGVRAVPPPSPAHPPSG